MRSGLIFYFLLDLCLFAQVSETTTPCDCKSESELLSWIKSGTIPELFLADFNTGSYQNWSSSVLCPSGKKPEILPESEDELRETQIEYDEWSCMYSAYSAYDGDIKTAWCEGVKGDGIGEVLLIPIDIYSEMSIWAGYGKSEKLYYANNRPKNIRLYYFQSYEQPEAVQSGIGFKNIVLVDRKDIVLVDKNCFQKLPNLSKSGNLSSVKAVFLAIEILSVYQGEKYNDTCITEVKNN